MFKATAAALLLAASAAAGAAEIQVSAGVALGAINYLSEPGATAGLAVDTPAGDGAWRLGIDRIGRQETTGGRQIGAYWNAGAQGIYFYHLGRARLEAGLGFAWRSEAEQIDFLLPSPLNFNLTLGARIGRASLQIRHLSNAYTRDTNRSQNWLQAAWAF